MWILRVESRITEDIRYAVAARREAAAAIARWPLSCIAYTMGPAVFEWDDSNRSKIKAHAVNTTEVEQALSRDPILI